jgi:hypothetical protein
MTSLADFRHIQLSSQAPRIGRDGWGVVSDSVDVRLSSLGVSFGAEIGDMLLDFRSIVRVG